MLREGSDGNLTEKLGLKKPENDTPFQNNAELDDLVDENKNLKNIIKEMKDEMIKIANEKQKEPKDETQNELNFFRSTNKKLISQLDSEKERLEIAEAELDIKARELEIGKLKNILLH